MIDNKILSDLVRAMAIYPIARAFVKDFSDEILETGSTEALTLASSIEVMASKSKVETSVERNAGKALYRVIRDAFEETLKARPASEASNAKPQTLVGPKVTKCPSTNEDGKIPKAPKAKGKSTASGDSKNSPAFSRQTIALPPVNVTVIPENHRAAARMAFFADARHVGHTQAGVSEDSEIVRKTDFNAIRFLDSRNPGQKPEDVMRKHRDIIGATKEGYLLLQQYEHHQIGAYAALDAARRILSHEHHHAALPDPLHEVSPRRWNVLPLKGTPTEDERFARQVAAIPAKAAVAMTIEKKRVWIPIPDAPAPTRFWAKGSDKVDDEPWTEIQEGAAGWVPVSSPEYQEKVKTLEDRALARAKRW